MLDPDRFFNHRTPGSQEWWYFDAISDDARDALVIVWYAALPFDPAYGTATLRHLANPEQTPPPDPLDHCAIGLSWYHEGRTVAYALNVFGRRDFAHRPDPFQIDVAGNYLDRDPSGYALRVRTPAVEPRQTLTASLSFRPVSGTRPSEFDLGEPHSPHHWILAAPDCRVEGVVRSDGPATRELNFQGRGYHDHNAGEEELSLAMRRWGWGRVHHGATTQVYYQAEPRHGPSRSLWITSEQGEPVTVREDPGFELASWTRNVYGMRSARSCTIGGDLRRVQATLVDDGPFYQRWLSRFTWAGAPEAVLGISEFLEAGRLHRPWFNWMIPYRLKRPGGNSAARLSHVNPRLRPT